MPLCNINKPIAICVGLIDNFENIFIFNWLRLFRIGFFECLCNILFSKETIIIFVKLFENDVDVDFEFKAKDYALERFEKEFQLWLKKLLTK